MDRLFHQIVEPANLPFTILLAVVLLYWLTVIVGALDVDVLNFDVTADTGANVDVDVHHEVDAPHDADFHADGFSWFGFLSFVNLGRVPTMIVISFFVFSLWLLSMLYNHYLGWLGAWLPLALLLPNILASLVVTKALTQPLVPVFKGFYEDQTATEIVGLHGTMLIGWEAGRFGVAKLRAGNKVLEVNVRSLDGTPLPKNTPVVVVQSSEHHHDVQHNVYLVHALDEHGGIHPANS
jgi:hypothetical protein